MRKRILAIALATTMAFSTAVVAVPSYKNAAVAQAADGDRAGTTLASRDVLEYYEAENMNYIDRQQKKRQEHRHLINFGVDIA